MTPDPHVPGIQETLDDWARPLAKLPLFARRAEIATKADALTGIVDDPLGECEAALARVSGDGSTPPAATTLGARLVCMADVEPEEVAWLWPARVPLGKVSLFIGDPGTLKSTTALYMAARVTAGGHWPDGGEPVPGRVIILTAEDGLADTVRPRIDLLGGDPSTIFVLEAVRDEKGERAFNLLRDVEALEEAVATKLARLVIIDPLSAYLAGTDSHKSAEVRQALAPLAKMGERTGAAILAVMHLNKSDSANALYRASGALDFVAAARSVIGFAADKDCDGRVLMVPVKMNLCAKPAGLGLCRVDSGLIFDDEPVTISAAEAFAGKTHGESDGMKAARTFLLATLAGGESIPARSLYAQAEDEGIGSDTLRRASVKLSVEKTKTAFGGGWTWRLP